MTAGARVPRGPMAQAPPLVDLASWLLHDLRCFFDHADGPTAPTRPLPPARTQGETFMITAFERVLVATDFSDPAYRALERAIDLARRYEARLHVVHVWETPTLVGPGAEWMASIEADARARLDELVAGLRAGKLEVGATLAQGAPWERILAVAEAERADLLVIGTHGRTGLRRALIGSVAERVVRHASAPVLTVH